MKPEILIQFSNIQNFLNNFAIECEKHSEIEQLVSDIRDMVLPAGDLRDTLVALRDFYINNRIITENVACSIHSMNRYVLIFKLKY